MVRNPRIRPIKLAPHTWALVGGQLVLNPHAVPVRLRVVPLGDEVAAMVARGMCSRGHTVTADSVRLVQRRGVAWNRRPRVMCAQCADLVADLEIEQCDVRLNVERSYG